MRKFIIGFLMAATAATPLAAQVSQERSERARERYERTAERNAARGGANRQEQKAAARDVRRTWNGGQAQAAQSPQAQLAQRQERRANRVERRADRPQLQGQPRYERRVERLENRADRIDRRADRLDDRGFEGRANQLERRSDRIDRRADRIEDRGDYRQNGRNYRQGQNRWDRNWRQDRRYNWQGYRYQNRALFSPGRYYAPYRGYGYNRFSIGIFLEPLFYGQRYWLSDPYAYRLPAAYPGTRWVRYYDDVLLVDTYTGEVVDVIHDFFW
jgi:hypothetical protein